MEDSGYLGVGEEHHILEVEDDGLVVSLDDGSVWDISLGEHTKSILWYPTMRVVVEEVDDDLYPFRLKNLNTAGPDEVRASLR